MKTQKFKILSLRMGITYHTIKWPINAKHICIL